MKEYLFRAKRYYDGEWVISSGIKIGELVGIWNDKTQGWDIAQKETIGQFTGKFDKNGKMIFEGDIVSGNNYVKQEKTYVSAIAEIAYCNDRAEFILKEFHSWVNEKVYSSCNVSLDYLSDIEVIGNIYDNPELLEGV